MKRLVSLILSLTLLLALALPASAADALWAEIGYESMEECLEWEGITAAQYDAIAAKSGAFDPYAYFAASELFPMLYGSAEDYKTDWDYSEEEFRAAMLASWFSDEAALLAEQNQRDALLLSLGGTPGQINVMYNGACLTFPDGIPEIKNDRTMVPMRSALEAMGAKVDYDHPTRTVTVTGEKASFTHVIGTDLIRLSDGSEVRMDVRSYINAGSTMVPVRFFAQVLALDVYWDNTLRTAVLVDKDAVIAEIDSHFTVLNGLIAASYEKLGDLTAYRSEADFSGDILIYDSINGNTKLSLSGNLAFTYGSEAFHLSGALDLGDISDLLLSAMSSGAELSLQETAMLVRLSDYLDPLEFDLIVNDSELYFRAPILPYLLNASGENLPEDFWMKTAVDEDLPALFQNTVNGYKDMTVGKIFYETFAASAGSDTFSLYQDLGLAADMMIAIMGDDTFTKRGDGWRWSMDTGDLEDLAEEMTGESISLKDAGIDDLDFFMDIAADGSMDFDFLMTMDDGSGTALRLEMQGESSDEASKVDMSMRLKNVCDIDLTIDSTVDYGVSEPAPTPGKGAVIVDEALSVLPEKK